MYYVYVRQGFWALIFVRVNQNLSESESKEIQNHIESCDYCKANYEETMVLMGAFKNEEAHKPSPELRKNFMNILDEEKQLQQK